MLNTVSPAKGSRQNSKRLGRGNSGNGGTTAGRGNKGQHSRTGSTRKAGFEGGQTPLLRRQPKLGGFKNPNRIEFEVINVGTLEEILDAGTYDVPTLIDKKIIKTKMPVKLLGKGELKKKFTITVNAASKTAVESIEKVGGKVVIE